MSTSWPSGSNAEAVLRASQEVERRKAQRRVREMEEWLEREWLWLDANERSGRYAERETRWIAALARYVEAMR